MLEELETARRELENARSRIATVGRAVYAIREGHEMNTGFGFHSHHEEMADENTEDEYGIHFEAGTPIVVLNYYHARWCDDINVVIPRSYLYDETYPTIERDALDARKQREEERQQRLTANAEQDRQARRKAMYEELKQEFE